ncbi:M57 family metalloprotease [Pedobacter nototheniae]|uniref:M57 family metalloprotease n=1 Tax=Pedobacter nototheniae TaxID=2488994 RepID=UPI00293007B0|nr:M57 family metalloprotease [Pedobacter nototheniae]
MKKKILYSLITFLIILTIQSCSKKQAVAPEQNTEIPETVLNKIKEMGFNTKGVQILNDGYIVEGDIFLPKNTLGKAASSANLIIAKSEQYQTYNLVQNLPRTITISVSNLPAVYSTAASNAVTRYNSLNLKINFQFVNSNGDIQIIGFNQAATSQGIKLGYGGFPFSGNPFNEIGLNTNPAAFGTNPDLGYITSVIQHEIGHCIGLRHTDYYDRGYSCANSQNEGNTYNSSDIQNFPGAIQIPGTPASADPNSFMLACSNGTDRTFNANDEVAIKYLYGYPTNTYSFRVTTMSNTPTYYGLILDGYYIAATISTPPVNATSTYVYNVNGYNPSSTLVVKISSGYIPVSATATPSSGSKVNGVINAAEKTITFSNLNMSTSNGFVSIAFKNFGLD